MINEVLMIVGILILAFVVYIWQAWSASSPAGFLPAKHNVSFDIRRLPGNPIIFHQMDETLIREAERFGYVNINGPSLIKVPAWVKNPLGKYYLYFAHHKGDYIRLAYAEYLSGPWKIYQPGTLHLKDSHFSLEAPKKSVSGRFRVLFRQVSTTEFWTLFKVGAAARKAAKTRGREGTKGSGFLQPHIASPEVVIDHEKQEIRMYYHGLLKGGTQLNRVAISKDGIQFKARPETISAPYLRVFKYRDETFGVAMPGLLYRSKNGLTDFEVRRKPLADVNMRHIGLWLEKSNLHLFWTQVGNAPERILYSQIDLSSENWSDWKMTEPVEVLRPETKWEGADQPIEASIRGEVTTRNNQLRDPFIFAEAGKIYLLYCGAGENNIGIAELIRK